MLKLNHVTKQYKKQIILDSISVEIEHPGLYIFQGINGSGKSTLLKLISKIIYKSSGSIENTFRISYLPDKFGMPKLSKVEKYLMDIFRVYRKDVHEVKALMEEYQIPKKRIGELSKGNLQKLGILQIISVDADCYVLDEPLDGLDDFAKRLFKEKIVEKLNQGKIVILSLHQKVLYSDLNPIIYEIKEGKCNEKKKKA